MTVHPAVYVYRYFFAGEEAGEGRLEVRPQPEGGMKATLTAEVSRLTEALSSSTSVPTPASLVEENVTLKVRCETLEERLEEEVEKAKKLRKSVEEKLELEEKFVGVEAAKVELRFGKLGGEGKKR